MCEMPLKICWVMSLDIPEGIIRHSASVIMSNKKLHILSTNYEKGVLCFVLLIDGCVVELRGLEVQRIIPVIPPAGSTHLVLSGENLFYVILIGNRYGYFGVEPSTVDTSAQNCCALSLEITHCCIELNERKQTKLADRMFSSQSHLFETPKSSRSFKR